MKDKIKELLRDYPDIEARESLTFFLCFNLLEDNNHTADKIRQAVYDKLNMLGIMD